VGALGAGDCAVPRLPSINGTPCVPSLFWKYTTSKPWRSTATSGGKSRKPDARLPSATTSRNADATHPPVLGQILSFDVDLLLEALPIQVADPIHGVVHHVPTSFQASPSGKAKHMEHNRPPVALMYSEFVPLPGSQFRQAPQPRECLLCYRRCVRRLSFRDDCLTLWTPNDRRQCHAHLDGLRGFAREVFVSEGADKLLELPLLGCFRRSLLWVLAAVDACHLNGHPASVGHDVEVGGLVTVKHLRGGPAKVL